MRLLNKIKRISLRGATLLSTTCSSAPRDCCPSDVTPPAPHDCPTGAALGGSIILTLSGMTNPVSGPAGIVEETAPVLNTFCQDGTLREGLIRFYSAWTNGSYTCNYVGRFNPAVNSDTLRYHPVCDPFIPGYPACDIDIWAYNTQMLSPGIYYPDGAPSVQLPVPFDCCCGPAFLLGNYDEFNIFQGFLGQRVGNLRVPCDIDILRNFCNDGNHSLWIKPGICTYLVGTPCAAPGPSPENQYNLYCLGSGNWIQGPLRMEIQLYRQIIAYRGVHTSGVDDEQCCDPTLYIQLQTYIVPRYWYPTYLDTADRYDAVGTLTSFSMAGGIDTSTTLTGSVAPSCCLPIVGDCTPCDSLDSFTVSISV